MLWVSPVRVAESLGSRSPRPRPQGFPSPPAPPTTPSPRCFQPEALSRPSRIPTPKAARSPRPLTSAAGPARPAAALSLRVRELLCPGSGPPSPRAPPPSGSVPRSLGPGSPNAPERSQPLNRLGHIWPCLALILASRHHLTNKKPRPATTPPSPPHRPLPRDSLPATTHGLVPTEPGGPTPGAGQPRVRTGQSPPQLRCVTNQGHLPVPVKIF